MVKVYFPNQALFPYVDCFNVISTWFENPVETIVSARGVPMLMFPFKSPPHTGLKHGYTENGYSKPNVEEPLVLTCSNTFNPCTFQGDINFVMILLKPTGAYHFLQNSMKGINNRGFTFKETGVFKYFDELQDRLWNIQQPDEAIWLIQEFLTRYLEQKARPGAGDFAPVMNHMLRNPSTLTVRDLARKFKCSERWIEKQCSLQTGLSPKSWLRLIRFRSATNYLLSNPQSSWMEVVARFQYHDQSHLIKDFHEFTGNPPMQHLAMNGRWETSLKQNELGLSRLIDQS